ncbi:MAG: DUF4270 domain-containing protein [Bacteroidales bacterium]|jgi:hypothetical protein|nr:DUF4270 domain-containing protein [Bacteroidales bacterium]
MQFKAFFRYLILPAAASLLTYSCISVDKTIGDNYVPDDYIMQVGTATFHMPLKTRVADSMQALNTSYGYFGAIRTKEFGLANFTCATNFAPVSSGMNLGTGAYVKKIFITMLLSGNSIPDASQEGITQNIHVYRMNKYVDTTDKYNNMIKSSDYIHTQINKGSTVYTGTDSLTIYLDNSLGEDILKATDLQLDSTTQFVKGYKGLYFTCDPPAAGTYGGRLNKWTVSSTYMYMQVNFQPTWKSGLARKDTTITFALGVDYAQNESTYESKAMESDTPQKYIDIEGVGGLKPYVDPVALKDTLDAWAAKQGYDKNRILISGATYYLPYELPTDESRVTSYYPQYLYPCHKVADTTDYYYYPLSDVYSTSNAVGAINRSLYYYEGQMASTIQKIMKADRKDVAAEPLYKLWIMPIVASSSSSYYSSSSSTTYSLDASTYTMGRINGPANANYPYIKIVYAILKDK